MIEIIVILIGFCLGVTIGLPFLARELGKRDIFWTMIEEGTTKMVMLNKAFWKPKMRYTGFHIAKKGDVDNNGNEIEEGEVIEDAKMSIRPKNFLKKLWQKYMGGLVWMGIYPFVGIYSYDFQWRKLEREKDGQTKVTPRNEILDNIFVKEKTYSVELRGAETKGNIQTNSIITLSVRINNPYKALFRTHQWFNFLLDTIMPVIREFYALNEFDNIKGSEKQATKKLYDFLNDANTNNKLSVIDLLKNNHGIFVARVSIENIDPSDNTLRDALAKQELAKLEAERIKIINDELDKHPNAIIVRQLEAAEKIGEKGNTFVFGLDSLIEKVGAKTGGVK